LSYLCDAALSAKHFVFRRAEFIAESAVEEGEVDLSAEVAAAGEAGGEGISDDIAAVEEDEEVLYSEGGRGGVEAKLDDSVDPSLRQVMKAAVAPAKWRAEVERVAPKLRIKPALSGREWRTHLEATRKHKEVLSSVFPDTHNSLEKISADVGGMVERVSTKERFINTTFQALAAEYKAVQDSQDGVSEKHREAADAVGTLTNDLAMLSDDLEELTSSLDDRGASITDTSPLVKIKAALSKLRGEIREMDTRVGVLGHRLMQHKLATGLVRSGKTRAGGVAEGEGSVSDGELDIEDDEP
jgi:estrogen-related receptor beta like 1